MYETRDTEGPGQNLAGMMLMGSAVAQDAHFGAYAEFAGGYERYPGSGKYHNYDWHSGYGYSVNHRTPEEAGRLAVELCKSQQAEANLDIVSVPCGEGSIHIFSQGIEPGTQFGPIDGAYPVSGTGRCLGILEAFREDGKPYLMIVIGIGDSKQEVRESWAQQKINLRRNIKADPPFGNEIIACNDRTNMPSQGGGESALRQGPDETFGAHARDAMTGWMTRNNVAQSDDAGTTLALVIQTALALQDFNPGPRDGILGPKTIAAIVAWQAMTGFAEGAGLADVLAEVLRTALVLQGFDPGPANGMLAPQALEVTAGWEDRFSSQLASAPSKGKDRWGALAFSKSTNGWAAGAGTNQPSQAHAVARALAGCRKSKRGDKCKQVLVWKNQCGALAVGDRSQYGAATGPTKHEAERNALLECRAATSNCEVRSKLSTCIAAIEDFERQPLGDFRVKVSSADRRVQVCVRDHECEDGDQVRVSVNGTQIFSGEIRNWWACRSVAVRSGPNPISMFAVNGTGYKGANCSHADANTGEMRVTGTTSVTQSWKHRGGAGSEARIVVQVE